MRGLRSYLVLLSALVAAVSTGLTRPAGAQALEQGARGPRFLLASPSSPSGTVPLDVSRTPALRQRIALELNGVTVKEALAAIARRAGLELVYTRDAVPLQSRVSLRASEITVAAALTDVLVDANVDVVFTPEGRAILKKRVGAQSLQMGTITGRVSDAKTGDALGGAEVYLEGTRWRASTGSDGRYRLADVQPGNHTLVARRVGYGKQSRAVVVAADQEVTIDVALLPVATQLNEIVTTVTGDQRRVELGHVVGRIAADSLVKEAPVSSLSELLTARVPGLQVFQSQGTVGGQVRLQVRGANSIELNNSPIVIIDGVRYTTQERPSLFGGPSNVEPSSPLNDLNPNDIESVEVVKGPSAATLYGTDAADGVLVITTKRGRAGPTRWQAYARSTVTEVPAQHFPDIYWGWGTVNGVPNNPTASCTLERLSNGTCTRQDSITVLRNPLNDPRYSIFGSKPRWEYGLNISGGQRALSYYFAADLEDATGPIQMPPALAEQLEAKKGLSELPEEWREPNAQTKLNLRSNITAVLGDRAELRFSTGYTKSDTRTLSTQNSPYAAAYSAATPINVDSTSTLVSPYGNNPGNPAQGFLQTATDRVDRFAGNVNGTWRPAPWLTTRATLGLDFLSSQLYGLVRPGDVANVFTSTGVAEDTRTRQVATTADLGATTTVRRGRLSARTAVGAQYVRSLTTASGSAGQNLPPGGSVPQNGATSSTSQAYTETIVLGGYFEEVLGFNERLFLTGALRLDGASTFGRDYDAAAYPKAGVSWLVSEEPLLRGLPGLDELRLRYAYGAAGKQPDPTWTRPLFREGGRMDLNGQVVNTMELGRLGDPGLRPERVREHEFGFDATALGSRLTLDVTWFRRRTADQIVRESGPPGRGLQFRNLGLTTQRGFEAQLKARLLDTRLVSWELMLQHADYTTTLLDIGNASMSRNLGGGTVEGYPLGSRFYVPIVGWQDVDGDGYIDNNTTELLRGDTAIYVGQSVPPRSQTFTSVLGLFQSRVRLSALLERKSGFTQFNPYLCGGGSNFRACRAAVDPSTPFAQQVQVLEPFFYGLAPGDFTRLREVTAVLELPGLLTRAVGLRRGSLAISARNLALWTKHFSGPDPEAGQVSTQARPQVHTQASGIPQGRVFSFRLDLGL